MVQKLKNLVRKLVYARGKINRLWYFQIKIRNLLTDKIKVGFGPVTSGEDDLAERKWRIDPIIDEINRRDCDYSAGFFIEPIEMKHFDLLVIAKKFNPSFVPIMADLKRRGRRFIYDIIDNPCCGDPYRYYFADHPEFSTQMDGFILSSPLQEPAARKYSNTLALIEHPVISPMHKRDYTERNAITILGQGYWENIKSLKLIEPVIREISQETGKKILLIYHSEEVFEGTDYVKYVKWTVKNCFKTMTEADIAVAIKDLHSPYQASKPSTKVIALMAAGLPVVCTPTVADQLVIKDGETGFFAYSREEWKSALRVLVIDAAYRERIGRAARASVIGKYSVGNITNKYISLFDRVRNPT